MNEVTFEVRLPQDLLKYGFDQDQVQQNVKEWLVLSLFTDDLISSGKAAKLLNISRVEFLKLLQKRGIAYINYSQQELDEEFTAVKSLNIEKTP